MNQQIIDYLQQNKTAYSKESLVQQLRTSGYVENDIQEAVNVVYGRTDQISVVQQKRMLSFDQIHRYSIRIAIVLILIYYAAIHPFSWIVGGLIYSLIGWLIPSAVNACISFWLVGFMKVHRLMRIGLFICISFVMGINTNLPFMVNQLVFSHQKITYEVNKKVNFIPNTLDYAVQLVKPAVYIPKNYYLSPIAVSGDEGCMCMYFKEVDDYNSLPMKGLNIYRSLGPSSRDEIDTSPEAIVFSIDKESDDFASFNIDIYENGQRTAWLKQSGMPIKKHDSNRASNRDNGGLSHFFFVNTTDELLHDNIWSMIVGALSQKGAQSKYKDFKKAAITNVIKKDEPIDITEEKKSAETKEYPANSDNKKSICYANATDIDISKYDNFKIEDAKLAMIGVDHANLGNYEKAAVCLEEALAGANKRSETSEVPKIYIDDIKLKLGTAYVNLGRIEEGRALFKEVNPAISD